ncbi:HNH endonuclease signature motif containing protein [Enterococcus wangshanyuanii]|uniref:HNH endonuclease signature motif containing protein n=1 Tax=Enterococcus wangshanyuanii TaxID=2005703 RepID=UPI001F361D13|nr:HNH endonuclease signature motif containing protein [Enterococcus wangshanyuanii]
MIWEKENGPIPAGHVLMFSDGNKENIRLDNLLLITQNQLLQMNRNGWIGEDREITETGLLLADLVSRLAEKKRSRKKEK